MEASGQLHSSAAFQTSKQPPIPVVLELGEPYSLLGHHRGKEIILFLPRIEYRFLGHLACGPAANSTVMFRFTTVYMVYTEKSIYDLM
jgi:hypothetical protein